MSRWVSLAAMALWSSSSWLAASEDTAATVEADGEELPVAVYTEEEAAFWQQCVAGQGAGRKISDLFIKILEGVPSNLQKRAEANLADEGVELVGQLCELHPTEFEALRLPAIIKSRLRRIRERGGKIPEDMLAHGLSAAGDPDVIPANAPGPEGPGQAGVDAGGSDPQAADVDMEGHDEL
eukprot:TRINITY_DN76622_c0_g1_i1.p1 TRINITY_DN76622_c0_g1~~TRINITY_DN76622_c0_g1_i1.p1  ORF type:complete len:181 (+),score=46.93 TRINITY_DN76622_c0_g1_i1:84-626(+)